MSFLATEKPLRHCFGGILLPERNLQGTCICLGFAVLACVATNVVPGQDGPNPRKMTGLGSISSFTADGFSVCLQVGEQCSKAS